MRMHGSFCGLPQLSLAEMVCLDLSYGTPCHNSKQCMAS